MWFQLTYIPLFISLIHAIPSPALTRRTESSPNPIASLYPNSVTGTINGTVAVVPIPFALARSIIPSKYNILKCAYEELLPGFPADSYPLIIQALLDHDIKAGGLSLIADFQSMHISYPFVDLLGDGYSSFQYTSYLLVTSTNLLAISGSLAYGTPTIPATFNPPDEAYGYDATSQTTFLNARTNFLSTTPSFSTRFAPQTSIGPWPLEFYVNVTNQPIFTSGTSCDNQIHLYNTTLSAVKTGVKGSVSIKVPFLPTDSTFSNVYGLRTDVAFIENNLVDCESLKGYSGTGSGD